MQEKITNTTGIYLLHVMSIDDDDSFLGERSTGKLSVKDNNAK